MNGMCESFKNKNSENESSHEADFDNQWNNIYKFAKVFQKLEEHQKDLIPMGYPVVDETGSIGTMMTGEGSGTEEMMKHSELEVCSYLDELGETHRIALHSYGGEKEYDPAPTMIAVETIVGTDGRRRLGSEPAVLVTDLDVSPGGKYAPLATNNELTVALYELFGNDDNIASGRNFLAATINHESTDIAQNQAFKDKIATRLQQRGSDPNFTSTPAPEHGWRVGGKMRPSAQFWREARRNMREEAPRDNQEMLDREWRQKGKLGRFAARVSKALYPKR